MSLIDEYIAKLRALDPAAADALGPDPNPNEVLLKIGDAHRTRVERLGGLYPGHPRWDDFMNRLTDGCDFREEDGTTRWTCKGGTDKTIATRILREMELTDKQTQATLAFCDANGGHCDCEIVFNVDP